MECTFSTTDLGDQMGAKIATFVSSASSADALDFDRGSGRGVTHGAGLGVG